jgi:NAD(P)-dependent dehydrogenase (short-subunit alcohol dehydrogenase family)
VLNASAVSDRLGGMTEGDLPGRLALVIGAGNSAGRTVALALAGAGMDVALAASTVDGEEVMAVRRTKRALANLGRRTPEYAFDTTLGQNVQVSTRQVAKELGGLDLLVNAQAARAPSGAATASGHISDSEWSRSLALQLSGIFFACRAAVREMASGGGVIVNVIHAASEDAGSMAAANAAAAGVIGLSQTLARENRDLGIRVNAIELGPGASEDQLAAAMLLLAATGSALTGQVLRLT